MKNKEMKSQIFQTSKNFIIFGAGVNGCWVYEQLKRMNRKVDFFLDDRHFEGMDGITAVNWEQLKESGIDLKESCVIISFYVKTRKDYNKLKDRLVQAGFLKENIFHFIEVLMESYFQKEKLRKEAADIRKSYERLKDEASREILKAYMEAILEEDAWKFSEPSENDQYFDQEIMSRMKLNGDAYFVDCGAYTGDTFESLQTQNFSMKYIGLEPDMNNFNLLAKKVQPLAKKYCPILFPCAASGKNELVSFNYSAEKSDSPGSRISEGGGIIVPAVSLDSVIAGAEITFLKMDIEGAEYNAVKGARRIISEQNPNLAICTYHKTEDIWRLINLIDEIYPKYDFYLRSYYLFGRETVLYAVPQR